MNEKKSIFSMRNIFKMLSLVCIVITFCPTFLVSCYGQKLDVSAMDLVTGISVYGEKSDPNPGLCCTSPAALPAVIFGIMFMKSLCARKSALITMVCAGTDTAVWMIVKAAFKNAAEQYYCSFETTGSYTFNMVILGSHYRAGRTGPPRKGTSRRGTDPDRDEPGGKEGALTRCHRRSARCPEQSPGWQGMSLRTSETGNRRKNRSATARNAENRSPMEAGSAHPAVHLFRKA